MLKEDPVSVMCYDVSNDVLDAWFKHFVPCTAMGIAKFYRWLAERYPLINQIISAEEIPEFDGLYLDMNGIIHTCSHGNDSPEGTFDNEDELWLRCFEYIDRLFRLITPKKVLYLAVDGVVPLHLGRAKMHFSLRNASWNRCRVKS